MERLSYILDSPQEPESWPRPLIIDIFLLFWPMNELHRKSTFYCHINQELDSTLRGKASFLRRKIASQTSVKFDVRKTVLNTKKQSEVYMGEKTNKLQVHPYKPVSLSPNHLSIYIYIYGLEIGRAHV